MTTAASNHAAERIHISTDMTIYHADMLKQDLLQAIERSKTLELDLSQVAEIDTAGIQLLMLAKRESQLQGKSLDIIAHSPAVHELIDFFNIAGYLGDPLIIPARQPA